MKEKYGLYLDSPAGEWELASPVGSGFAGAMIYGIPGCERIQLSYEHIWAGDVQDTKNDGFRAYIDELRRLLLEGKAPEADAYAKSAPGISFGRVKSNETAGELLFDFGDASPVGDYRRDLDLENGVSRVSFTKNGEEYVRETFASYPDNVIAARHTGPHSVTVCYTRLPLTHKWGQLPPLDIPHDGRFGVKSVETAGDTLLARCATADGKHDFAVKLRVETDGELTACGDTLVIRNARKTDYIIAIAVGADPILPEESYDTLYARSAADHASLMDRADLAFAEGDDPYASLSVDKRLERLKNDPEASDPWLVSLYFRFGRYLLIGSSRPGSLPAHLQGVWNGYTEAPWNTDYHTNINLQMNYWPAEVTNLSDCALPLFDYMNGYLLEPGRATACDNYRCRGTVLHHLSDLYGFTAPADGVWGLWPLGAAWLSFSMWEHYLYTLDRDFLRDTAYEYIRDAARFFLDYMFEDGEGRLVTGPSTSPENRYFLGATPCSLCLSPSMDIEIIGGLLRFYIKTEEILGLNPAWADEARAALARMPSLEVGKHGQLMEWMEDYDEPEPGHRHVSHLFALYPDCSISSDTPELFAAAKKTLERRLASGGGHTGWSCAWLIALFARLGDREGVKNTVRKLLVNSTRGGLLDSHPPFQIDGNFGATAALAESVLQSHNGRIVLLPALPEDFPDGHFEGLCGRGGVEVSTSWKDGRVVKVCVKAVRADYDGEIVLNGKTMKIKLEKGETTVL